MKTHRAPTLAKGDWGKLLILGGSSQLGGATVLNTAGALRTGLDLVVVAAPERASTAVLHHYPDAVSIALPGRHFETRFMKFLKQFSGYPVVIGSGITTQREVGKFVRHVLGSFRGPFVIDADALRIVARSRNPAKLWGDKTVILTPNRAEYAAMAGESSDHPLTTITALATKYRATILCKGPGDVLSDGTRTVEISGGSPFLAKAGSGDILSGVIGALLARGVSPFEAAEEGSRLLHAASETAERRHGPGFLAGEIADALHAPVPPEPPPNPKPPKAPAP